MDNDVKSLFDRVSSPFQKVLYWPAEKKIVKKRQNKEKIPSILTGELGREWMEHKEEKKRKQEEDKEIKKKIRLAKMEIKKEKEEEKKKKIQKEKEPKGKKNNKTTRVPKKTLTTKT